MFDSLSVVLSRESMKNFSDDIREYLEILGKESSLYISILEGMEISEEYLSKFSY